MNSITAFIYYNSNEKKSLTILLLLIAILLTTSTYVKKRFVPEIVDLSNYDSLFQENITPESINKNLVKTNKRPTYKQLNNSKEHLSTGFTFDPNYASKDTLQIIGINEFASKNLIKYRENGGTFKKPEDIKKIYGITEKLYTNIEKKIKIRETLPTKENINALKFENYDTISQFVISEPVKNNTSTINEPENKNILIDVNTADEIQLQYVKGIGPSFARRIIKYRELIGGYHSLTQLLEVYGIDREKYEEIRNQMTISGNLNPMDINTLDYASLGKHPYISYQEAKLIVAYHKKHGPYKHVYDIVKIGVMDSNFIDRILPYIPDSLIYQKAQAPLTSL